MERLGSGWLWVLKPLLLPPFFDFSSFLTTLGESQLPYLSSQLHPFLILLPLPCLYMYMYTYTSTLLASCQSRLCTAVPSFRFSHTSIHPCFAFCYLSPHLLSVPATYFHSDLYPATYLPPPTLVLALQSFHHPFLYLALDHANFLSTMHLSHPSLACLLLLSQPCISIHLRLGVVFMFKQCVSLPALSHEAYHLFVSSLPWPCTVRSDVIVLHHVKHLQH